MFVLQSEDNAMLMFQYNYRPWTRLRIDRVKPWNSMRINLGLGLRGPDIRPGVDNRHLILEGDKKS